MSFLFLKNELFVNEVEFQELSNKTSSSYESGTFTVIIVERE